ncbi:MAG: LytR/AlgR family response regulator transcription factor [Lachnospiraceae bacterium]
MKVPYNVAVCEDRKEDMEWLCTQLTASQVAMNLHCFHSGEAFLQSCVTEHYQIVFLDIYMKGMTGIETAQQLRAQDNDCIIIFTTSSREHTFESYQVQALQYLLKPTRQEDVNRALQQAIKLSTPGQEPYCVVLSNKKELSIALRQIMYVDIYNRTCTIHTTAGEISTYTSMDALEKMLPSPPFLRCHRAYIVNLNYVEELTQDFIMKNGDIVYIRQRDYRKVRDTYMRNIIQGVRETGYAD